MPRYQTTGQNRYIKVANKSFENVVKFRYLGMTVINGDCIREQMKSGLNLGTVC
jgi:hypothetical protein